MAAAAGTLSIPRLSSASLISFPSPSSSSSVSTLSLPSPSRRPSSRLLASPLLSDVARLFAVASPSPRKPLLIKVPLRSAASATAAAAAPTVLSLPTAKPDREPAGEKLPNWSSRSIKSFAMGELEARKLKYPNTGTEALLMGILVEGTSQASRYLRANGVTLLKVREESVKLLGKSDLYFFSPEHPPLTEAAQRALDWAVDEKLKSGKDGEITTTHMLLGICSEKESAGYKILASFGFDDEKVQELAKSADVEVDLRYR